MAAARQFAPAASEVPRDRAAITLPFGDGATAHGLQQRASMTSVLHEALVDVVRSKPSVLVELLRGVDGVIVPAHDQVESVSADLGSALPVELRADASFRLVRERAAALTVVLEVQLDVDRKKRFTWPAYLANARLRDRCDAVVVVVTVDRRVARWARKSIELGPGSFMRPIVIGPDEVAPILSVDEASRAPELAIVSALAHAKDADTHRSARIAETALQVALSLGGDRGVEYYDLILATLSEAARRALDMAIANYQFQDEGLHKAWAKGKTEGEAKGKAEGAAEGKAESVLAVLDARGVAVTDAQRARIVASTDLSELDRWVRAAATVAACDDIFEPT